MTVAPFFVVGSGRSGTTLLRGMLNTSPAVHVPPESDFVARGYSIWGLRSDLGPAEYPVIAEFFRISSQDAGWGMPRERIVAALDAAQPRDFAAVNDAIYRAYLTDQGLAACQWGIKSPVLVAGLDAVFATFPAARVIHLLRDGRDVYLSYRRVHDDEDASSFGPRTPAQAALYWADGVRRVAARRDDPRVLEQTYERLLDDPDTSLRGICAHLGIPYDEAMWRDYHRSERNRDLVRSRQDRAIHRKVTSGLDPANTRRWAEEMDRRAQLTFEAIAGPELARHGYPLDHAWVAVARPVRWLALRAARVFNDRRYGRRDGRILDRARQNVSEATSIRS